MSGYTEIVKTLKEIRDFLHDKMSPQFMDAIKGAAEAIQKTLGDPAVQAALKDSLVQLDVFLKNVNQADLVNQLSGIAGDVRAILQNIDPEAVGNIINSLNNLLQEADKAGLIQNIMKALDSVSSLRDLIDIAKDLALPAKILMYGATGAFIGTALTTVIQAYISNKKDTQLQESIDKLIAINAQQLYLQIQNLRQNAKHNLIRVEVIQHRNPQLVFSERSMRSIEEDRRYVDVLSPIDINSLELLEKAQEFGRKMLAALYQAELDNESMSDYLDRVNIDMGHWDRLIEFVSHHPNYTVFGGIKKPTLPRDDLNYWQIKKLYGDSQINAIMQSLVQDFIANGGNDLYVSLTNSSDYTSYGLSESIKQIPKEMPDFAADAPWSDSIRRLHTRYHQQANQHITAQWEITDWTHLPHGRQILPERVRHIIRTRALVEFCHQTAPYLCFPRNLHREIYNGAKDIPASAYQLMFHPINSVSNLSQTLFTINGWKSLGHGIYAHPVRFLTSQLVSAGAAAGVSSVASKLTHVAKIKPPVTFRAPGGTVSVGSPVASTAGSATAGAAAGTVPLGISRKEAARVEGAEIEMMKSHEPSAPEISPQSNSLLITRLQSQKLESHDELYELLFNWYEETQAKDNRLKMSSPVKVGLFSSHGSREPAQEILHAAAKGNAQYLSELLLKYPEHLNAVDGNPKQGWTALHLSVKYNQHQCVSVLLEKGALYDIKDKTEEQLTASDICLLNNNDEIKALFTSHMMLKYLPERAGTMEKALRKASFVGDISAVRMFVFQGSDLSDAEPDSGKTALHLATQSEHIHIVCFLMEAGADVSIVDAANNQAIDYADKNKVLCEALSCHQNKAVLG